MGVIKNMKSKTKKEDLKKTVDSGKPKDKKVKKKNKVSCLQCIKSPSDDGRLFLDAYSSLSQWSKSYFIRIHERKYCWQLPRVASL